jgi:hypothetical protein
MEEIDNSGMFLQRVGGHARATGYRHRAPGQEQKQSQVDGWAQRSTWAHREMPVAQSIFVEYRRIHPHWALAWYYFWARVALMPQVAQPRWLE